MKTIAVIALLALAAPAAAQQKKLLDAKVPDEKAAAAEAKPAAEIAAAQQGKAAPAAKTEAQAASKAPEKASPASAAAPAAPKRARRAAKKPAAAPAAEVRPASMPEGFVLRPDAQRVLPKEQLSGGFKVRKRHTVSKGDTLWDLSGKYYNNPFMWGRIYNANFGTVADPDLINPSEELLIPDLEEVVLPYRRGAPEAAAAAEVAEAEAAAEGKPLQPWERSRAALARKVKAAPPQPGEILADFDSDFISEEMPEDQREWGSGVRIVPDSWSEDGVVVAKARTEDDFAGDSLNQSGEVLEIDMNDDGLVRAGDYLAVYLKGGEAYDRAGEYLGREIQPAGLAEVLSVDGVTVKARIIDATTAIFKGYIVKRK